MKKYRKLSMLLAVCTAASLLAAVPSAFADNSETWVYKASEAWYEPADGASVTENTYNGHTEWKWQRKDSDQDWFDFAQYHTAKGSFGMTPGQTNTGDARTAGKAWSTAGGAWNHPAVGEGWMIPLLQSGNPGYAVSRAFTAPKSGKVILSTEDGNIYAGSSNPGNALNRTAFVRITLNGVQVWPETPETDTDELKTGYGMRMPEDTTQTYAFEPVLLTLAQGDVLRFEVSNGDSTAQYGKLVFWQPVVTYYGAESSELLYCSANGTTAGKGTEEDPTTFQTALAALNDGGTVKIIGEIDLEDGFSWPKTDKTVTVLGHGANARLDITALHTLDINTGVVFENIEIGCDAVGTDGAGTNRVAANGNHVVIRDTVTTSGVIGALLGGSFAAGVSSTNLEVYGGKYHAIYGGSSSDGGGAVSVNGNCDLKVGGNVNADLDTEDWDSVRRAVIHGGGYGGTVTGNCTLTLSGAAKAKYVYGGQNGGYASQNLGQVTVNVEGGNFMNIYGILKNTRNENNTAVNNEGTKSRIVMTGGTAEALIGAQEGINGQVEISALGGTVTRRIIGGVYNDVASAGNRDGHVTGTTTIVIGGGLGGLNYNTLSKGIYPGSRTSQTYAEEVSTVIFLDGTYDIYGGMLSDSYHDDLGLSASKWDYLVNATAGGTVAPGTAAGMVTLAPESGYSVLVDDSLYTDTDTELALTRNQIANIVFCSNAEARLLSCDYADGTLAVQYIAADSATLIAAVYRNGCLTAFAVQQVGPGSGEQAFTITADSEDEIVVMMWDSVEQVTPCCAAKQITLSAQ